MSLLKIFKFSYKSLLASNLALSEHFPKISKVTLFQKCHFWKIIDLHEKYSWHHPKHFPWFSKKKIKSATFEIYKRFVPAEVQNHNDIRQLDHLKILLRSLAATTLAVASHVINAICIAYIHIFIYIELLLSTCTMYVCTYNTSCRDQCVRTNTTVVV